MNWLSWYTEDNYFTVPGDQYNEEFNNWLGTMPNGQFHPYILKDTSNIEEKCNKYDWSVKFNNIPREGYP